MRYLALPTRPQATALQHGGLTSGDPGVKTPHQKEAGRHTWRPETPRTVDKRPVQLPPLAWVAWAFPRDRWQWHKLCCCCFSLGKQMSTLVWMHPVM